MKCILAIIVSMFLSIVSLPLAVDAAVFDPDMPDIPSFIGYAPNKIVVKFGPPILQMLDRAALPQGRTGIPALDQVGTRLGVNFIRPQFPGARGMVYRGRMINLAGWHKVHFAGDVDVLAAVDEYRRIPGVIDAQPVSIHTVYREPNDEFYNNVVENVIQWHLPQVKAPQAWDIETGKPSVVVAVLDTGVRYFQRDLGGANASYSTPTNVDGNMWINLAEKYGTDGIDDDGNGYIDDWIGWDFVTEAYEDIFITCYPEDYLGLGEEGEDCGTQDNDPRDFNGHGTHCAGSVAAITNNGEAVASLAGGWGDGTLQQSGNGAKVMALRIGWHALYWGIIEIGLLEMDYAAEAFYYAANNGSKIATCSWGSENTAGIGDAIDYFLGSGGLIFKAAGNDSSQSPYNDYMSGRDDIVTVAATDEFDCKASFSNYGSWIDISAPGVFIWSLYHYHYDPVTDYVTPMDGTSMAAPLAASAAALIWSQNPGWSADQVKQKLFNSADNIDDALDAYGSPCNSSYVGKLGAGRINAFQAVSQAGPPSNTPPVAVDDTATTLSNTPVIIYVLENDIDVDGDQLTVASVTQATEGSVSINADNKTVTYSPNTGFIGTDSFTYVANDGEADSNVATVSIAITPAAPQIGVSILETGWYETTGRGRNRTTVFNESNTFNAGDEVVIRAYVVDTMTGQPVAYSTVNIDITGPEAQNLTAGPSGSDGIAEATWKTSAPKRRKPGTPTGQYIATITNVVADGYSWDEAHTNTTFAIQ